MLNGEKSSRDAAELNLSKRIESCEHTLSAEAQRLWLALDGHTHDNNEPVEAPVHARPVQVSMPQQFETVMSPRTVVPVPQYSVVRQGSQVYLPSSASVTMPMSDL